MEIPIPTELFLIVNIHKLEIFVKFLLIQKHIQRLFHINQKALL